MRKVLSDLKEATKGLATVMEEGLTVHDEDITASDGGKVRLRVYQPDAGLPQYPALF